MEGQVEEQLNPIEPDKSRNGSSALNSNGIIFRFQY